MLLTLKSAVILYYSIALVNSLSNEEQTMSEEDDSSMETATVSTVMEKDLPLDLYDIGYVGTWERFCDADEIKKEFTLYPHYHVLMQLRNTICKLRRRNEIDRNAILSFAVYKYCESMRTRVDAMLAALISKFSFDDENKKMELLDEGPVMDFTDCYKEAIVEFKRKCIGEENPYFEMFKPLIGRVCFVEWSRMDDVLEHIHNVCNGKWITDQIDWDPILASIIYKDGTGNTGFTIRSTSPIVNLSRLTVDERK